MDYPSTENKAKASGTFLKLILAAAVFLVLFFLPTPRGLTLEGKRAIAVTATVVVLWVTEVANMSVVGLLAVILLAITSAVPSLKDALYGFSQPLVYFLFGVLVIGLAARKTGLADSAARYLITGSRGRMKILYYQLIASFALLAYILPSATTRNGIQIPIYEKALRLTGYAHRSQTTKLIMIAMASLNRLGSTALLTGGIAPVTAAALLGGFSWGRWFIMMALPYYSMLILGSIAVYFLFRPKNGYSPMVPTELTTQRKRRRISCDEKKVAAVLLGAILLWSTDFIHHMSPAIIALLAAVVIMAPGVRILSWRELEKSFPWSAVFVVATSLCLGYAITASGAAAWFAGILVRSVAIFPQNPFTLLFLLMLATNIVRLGIPNVTALYSIMIPVAFIFAQQVGLNPLLCGLVVTIVPDSVVYYAAQSASSVMVYDRGYFSARELLVVGIVMTVISYVVILLVAIPYWGLLGERLFN